MVWPAALGFFVHSGAGASAKDAGAAAATSAGKVAELSRWTAESWTAVKVAALAACTLGTARLTQQSRILEETKKT